MKKLSYFTLTLFSLFFISCSNGITNADKISSLVIKDEQRHLDNYNQIRRLTNDTNVIKYVDSLKKEYLSKAYKSMGFLESSKGIIHGDLEEPIKLLNTYIDSVK